MTTANYKCSQQELYTISRVAWKSCQTYLADFAAFSPRYDAALLTAAFAAIEAAAVLPDAQARGEKSELLRIQLAKLGNDSTDLYQRLKRYIAKAFAEDAQKTRLDAAGQMHYAGASSQNWDSVDALNTSASNFLAANSAALTANQNMPTTFQATFNAAKTAFAAAHTAFLSEEGGNPTDTQTKVAANNALYEDLMTMLLDGQEIFKRNDAVRKQFTFSELLYLASGAGTAGIKGYITDTATLFAIEGVHISIFGSKRTAETDNEGRYEISQLAAGVYNLTFVKKGYATVTLDGFEVKVGTSSSHSFAMTPIDDSKDGRNPKTGDA
jgi:hypothetical protein